MDSKQAAVALCDRACAHMPARVDPILPMYIKGACAGCIALALDAFARERCDNGDREWEKICREREAAVWEEAAKLVEAMIEPPMGVNTGTIWRNSQTKLIIEKIRARAAEARRTG